MTRRVYMSELYEKIHSLVKDLDMPIRLMGIECGGVATAYKLFIYLSERGVKDVGVFSIDISRKKQRLLNRRQLEREIDPLFLHGAFLIAVDDQVGRGHTKEIVDRVVEGYIRPRYGIARYEFAAVTTSVDLRGRPLADIYSGEVVDDASYDPLLDLGQSLHIVPRLNRTSGYQGEYRDVKPLSRHGGLIPKKIVREHPKGEDMAKIILENIVSV